MFILVLIFVFFCRQVASQQLSDVLSSFQIRPNLSISDRVLPIQLVDTTDPSIRVPRRKQLKLQVLSGLLGADFDSAWMSVEKPAPKSHHVDVAGNVSRHLLDDLKKLNLSRDGLGVTDDATVLKFERWLLQKATCPVTYVWDDVGPMFWPRWIKRGQCEVAAAGTACSWPPGMHCVPAESLTLHLLRWYCRPRPATKNKKKQKPKLRCQWLKVPYPVTSKCHCSC